MQYNALVLDFFGVVCSEVAPFWLAEHMPPEKASNVKRSIVGAADRGDISQADLFQRLSELTSVPPAQIESEWLAYATIDTQMVMLVQSLKKALKLGLLTNSPTPFVRDILRTHDIEQLFDCIVVSSEIKAAKPHPDVYRAILQDLSLPPEAVLFVDDNPVNIAGSQRVGIRGVLFESHDALLHSLEGFGIVPAVR